MPILFAEILRLWYAIPLLISVSLVYGATRHELPRPILEHAVRFGGWMLSFLGILFVVIWLVSSSL